MASLQLLHAGNRGNPWHCCSATALDGHLELMSSATVMTKPPSLPAASSVGTASGRTQRRQERARAQPSRRRLGSSGKEINRPSQSVKRTFQNAQAPRHRRRAGHTQREAPWRAGHGTTTQGRARRHTLNTGRDSGAHSPRQQGQRAPPKESLHHVQCCRPTHSPSPARARPRAASITHRTHSHALQ